MKELISESEKIKNDDYTADSWNALQKAIASAKNLMKYTGEDKGALELAKVYDKTNDGDNDKDMLNYYGYAQGDYQNDGTTTLKTGFSTLLDKTMNDKLVIEQKIFEYNYNNLLKAKLGLQKKPVVKKDDGKNTNTVQKISLKAGKKIVKSGKTITLKPGKTLQLKLTVNGVKAKNVKYTTSNKKIVKVSKKGKIKALKKSKKAVKVTISFGNSKILLKIKTK